MQHIYVTTGFIGTRIGSSGNMFHGCPMLQVGATEEEEEEEEEEECADSAAVDYK
jgi:hypothetical protein